MSKAHGPLADRPNNPKVGLEIPHESAVCTSPARRCTPHDLVAPDQGPAARLAGAGAARARHDHRAARRRRLRGARRGQGADRRGRARAQRRRREARRAAVPQRGDVLRARRLLGARRDAGRGPAGRGGDRGRVRAAAVAGDASGTPSRRRASRASPHGQPGRRRCRPGGRGAHRFTGEFEFGGQEHFYLETNAALALVDENGQIFVQSSTQHPSETQEIVAHVLGLHAHQVTVQCLRMGGGFGGKEFQPHGLAAIAALGATLTGRPVLPAAQPHPGHHDDRQAAPVPGDLGGRASTPTTGSARCGPR